MVFDPFAYLDETQTEEVTRVDMEMITVEVGGKILGIDEGMFIGIILGLILAQAIGGIF